MKGGFGSVNCGSKTGTLEYVNTRFHKSIILTTLSLFPFQIADMLPPCIDYSVLRVVHTVSRCLSCYGLMRVLTQEHQGF